ncbi:MAG: hypothetical protein PF447_11465 [Spirochaetaceae bacterium]|jgi:hypothetical protein|nr:hypothetical protein [Spirochaetaceae bacterium]
MKYSFMIFILCILVTGLYAQADLSLDFSAEFGFTSINRHVIQSGTTSDKGDVFNYVTQGNQDVLFPFSRYQVDLSLYQRHHVIFLYQPLTLVTQSPIKDDFRYDSVDYTTTDGFLDLTYAFDFWRFSYLYDLIEPDGFFLSTGLSLQIRNASIVFRASQSPDGSVTDNIGPVPIIKTRLGYRWTNGLFIMFDGDGFYASNRFFNGADYPFTGYIYDLSLRGGYSFNDKSTAYLNARFLGGGAEGTNDIEEYTYNDLHTFTLCIGILMHL